MSDDTLSILANAAGVFAWGAAFVGVLMMPARPGGFMRGGIKLLLGGAMSIYLFVSASHLLQFTHVTSALDIFENYVKTLFIPLVAAAAYALVMNEQLRVTHRQANILSAEHDMLMRIVDTTPTGVVVLDPTGRIEFANDRARDMLELKEDPDTCRVLTPEWVAGDMPGTQPGDLSVCVPVSEVRDQRCTLCWPDGTTRQLSLNATPIIAADGTRVGSVVALAVVESASVA